MKKGQSKEKASPPSRASLRDIPEVDLERAKVGRNPYAARIAAGGMSLKVGRGRPPKGTEPGPTTLRSVRLPAELWRRLERRARADGMPLLAALRAAVIAWLGDDRPVAKRTRHPGGPRAKAE